MKSTTRIFLLKRVLNYMYQFTWVKVQNSQNPDFLKFDFLKSCRMATQVDNLKLKWLIVFKKSED